MEGDTQFLKGADDSLRFWEMPVSQSPAQSTDCRKMHKITEHHPLQTKSELLTYFITIEHKSNSFREKYSSYSYKKKYSQSTSVCKLKEAAVWLLEEAAVWLPQARMLFSTHIFYHMSCKNSLSFLRKLLYNKLNLKCYSIFLVHKCLSQSSKGSS